SKLAIQPSRIMVSTAGRTTSNPATKGRNRWGMASLRDGACSDGLHRHARTNVRRGKLHSYGATSAMRRAPEGLCSPSHRHHVAVEIGDDHDRAGDDKKDDQYAEREGENIIGALGSAAQMQEEDEMDADLREGEYDQADGYARGP